MLLKVNEGIKDLPVLNRPTGRQDYLCLDYNEGYLDVTDQPFVSIKEMFDPVTLYRYPEYDIFLEGLENYVGISSEHIALTNGSCQGLDLLCRLFFNKESRVIVPSPVFSYTYHVLQSVGAEIVPILYQKAQDGFIFPVAEILEELPKSQGVMLCHPNNPLGTPIPKNDLYCLIAATAERDIPCIVDEAYFEFYGESVVSLLAENPHLIVTRTFSKYFCLAGLRLGYVVAHPTVVKHLRRLRGMRDINGLAVFAGKVCLEHLDFFETKREEGERIKREIYHLLSELKKPFYKSSTNFMVIQSDAAFMDHFKKNKILVADISKHPHNRGLTQDMIRLTTPSLKDFPQLKEVLLTA